MVKCSKDLLPDNCNRHIGHAGVAILWKKSFRSVIVEVDSDRMCCLKIATDRDTDIYVIAVYLPPIGSRIADFSHNLDILHQLTLDLQSKEVVCIIGDLNVKFDVISGRRGDGIPPSRYCKITLEMMQECDLIAADMSDIATGPYYTFLRNGIGTSYIDHCLVSRKLMNHEKWCGIIDEHYLNSSDHLPVAISIHTDRSIRQDENESIPRNKGLSRVAWSRVTQEEINVKYTCPVSKDIIALRKTYGISSDSCLLRRMDIDRFINDLITILLRRSGGLPKVKFKKCLKPYWSNQLKEDRIVVKNLWREWDSAGRPRSHNSDIFSRYKEAKKVYRDNIRKAERDYEVKWANDVI